MSKKYTVNQVFMSLSTYYLEDGRHLARHHRRRRAYAPTSNTASHDNHEKINSWVSFSFLYGHGGPLGGPWGRRSSAINSAKITNLESKNFLVTSWHIDQSKRFLIYTKIHFLSNSHQYNSVMPSQNCI